jgi:hypothetical protein
VAEWAPFQTHYFSENLVGPGIDPGPLDLGPGVYSASNRNEYQKQRNNVSEK